MKIQTKKLACCLGLCFAVATLSSSCESGRMHHKDEINDCSGIFDTHYIDNEKGIAVNVGKDKTTTTQEINPSVCRILELTIDKKTKCEVVGSDKIDSLTKVMSENKDNKFIFIIPQDKMNDLKRIADYYISDKLSVISSGSVDFSKYVNSDLVKNLDFKYKGMRCMSADKEFILWAGDKRVILILNL